MLVHRIFASVKKILPSKLSSIIRSFFTAFLTPFYFSYENGHFLSSFRNRAVDKRGYAIPWYTYPTVDFLTSKDFTDRYILEFGSGQSTLWWAKRAKLVLSFEEDERWYRYVKKRIPVNVKIHNIPNNLHMIESYVNNCLFDVIIIDGFDRVRAARKSIPLLRKNGAIILDNSEGFWGKESTYPIMDLFRSEGFSRIDFYGYAAGVILPHCTSLFFKDSCFLVEGAGNPVRKIR